MTLTQRLLAPLSGLALAFALACGGGGGGSTNSGTAPTITTQPVAQTVLSGSTATFSVTATGTPPLTYLWKKGGATIVGAPNAPSYTTPATVVGDNGAAYTVTVSNAAGSVTSASALLTVQASAATLAYTDPTTGTYLLKKNTTLSSGTHLVLELVGPAGTTGTGVSVAFSTDTTKVTWTNVAPGDAPSTFVANGTALTLGVAPQILKAKVAGNSLQATVAQKGTGSPVSLNAPLLRVALDLKPSQTPGPITLSADSAKCQVLDGAGTISGITVTVGTLTAQ